MKTLTFSSVGLTAWLAVTSVCQAQQLPTQFRLREAYNDVVVFEQDYGWDYAEKQVSRFFMKFPVGTIAPNSLSAASPFEVSIGDEVIYSGKLGDDPAYRPGTARANIVLRAENDNGDMRVCGRVRLMSNPQGLIVRGLTRDTTAVAEPLSTEDPGPVSEEGVEVRVVVGGWTNVFATGMSGTVRVKTRIMPDDEFELAHVRVQNAGPTLIVETEDGDED